MRILLIWWEISGFLVFFVRDLVSSGLFPSGLYDISRRHRNSTQSRCCSTHRDVNPSPNRFPLYIHTTNLSQSLVLILWLPCVGLNFSFKSNTAGFLLEVRLNWFFYRGKKARWKDCLTPFCLTSTPRGRERNGERGTKGLLWVIEVLSHFVSRVTRKQPLLVLPAVFDPPAGPGASDVPRCSSKNRSGERQHLASSLNQIHA